MSLISDAIKKAQKKREQEKESLDYLPPPESRKKKKEKSVEIKVLQISFVIFFLLISVLAITYFISKLTPSLEKRNVVLNQLQQVKKEENKPTPEKFKKNDSQNKKKSIVITEKLLPEFKKPPSKAEKVSPTSSTLPPAQTRSLLKKSQQEIQKEVKPVISIIRKEQKRKSCIELLSEDLRAAERCFESEMELRAKDFPFLFNYGACELKLGKWNKAEELFRKALSLKPYSSKAWFNLGIALFRQQKLNEAESAFSLSLRFSPSVKEANYYLGVINDLKGNIRAAKFYYALSLESSIPPNLKNWVKKRLAELEK